MTDLEKFALEVLETAGPHVWRVGGVPVVAVEAARVAGVWLIVSRRFDGLARIEDRSVFSRGELVCPANAACVRSLVKRAVREAERAGVI